MYPVAPPSQLTLVPPFLGFSGNRVSRSCRIWGQMFGLFVQEMFEALLMGVSSAPPSRFPPLPSLGAAQRPENLIKA